MYVRQKFTIGLSRSSLSWYGKQWEHKGQRVSNEHMQGPELAKRMELHMQEDAFVRGIHLLRSQNFGLRKEELRGCGSFKMDWGCNFVTSCGKSNFHPNRLLNNRPKYIGMLADPGTPKSHAEIRLFVPDLNSI